jgi:hypothetical protein
MVTMGCETRRCRGHCSTGRVCHVVSRRPRRCHHRPGGGPVGHDAVGRCYDPATGQFLSVDPKVEQTLEAFEYAGGDPVSETDPSGMTGYSPTPRDACEAAEPYLSCTGGFGLSWDVFAEIVHVGSRAVHWVKTHPKVDLGVGLTLVSLATGGAGFLFDLGDAAELVSNISTLTGVVGGSLDYEACRAGDRVSCAAAAASVVGTGADVEAETLSDGDIDQAAEKALLEKVSWRLNIVGAGLDLGGMLLERNK